RHERRRIRARRPLPYHFATEERQLSLVATVSYSPSRRREPVAERSAGPGGIGGWIELATRRGLRSARGLGLRGRRGGALDGGGRGRSGGSGGAAGPMAGRRRGAARRPTAEIADLPPSAVPVLAGQPG